MDQKHLKFKDTVNFGSFYTPKWLVDIVYNMLLKHINNIDNYYIIDTSCGYGAFLRGNKAIGADIDIDAIINAKNLNPNGVYFHHNSLLNVSRTQYNLEIDDNIIIVGNPPYNDTTSIIRNNIKKEEFSRDEDIVSRDLGISFLMSYSKLKANYICVLHPLSYLIKKTNFESLKFFKNNYKLKDSLIISSEKFTQTSKTTFFPIIIGLYERDYWGMDYDYILNYEFKTEEGKKLKLKNYDSVGNYLTKYPNQKYVNEKDTIANFWTMRDINALKRSRTFIEKESDNTIRVTERNFPYYCYVDVFKEYISHIPYYLGNSDVMIDKPYFERIKSHFINKSLSKHSKIIKTKIESDNSYSDKVIEEYFKKLLGEHYVDK